MPSAKLCQELRRSESSVRAKIRELNSSGACLSLRYYEPTLIWCAQCATWRTRLFGKTGQCLVCRSRQRLERIQDNCEEELSHVSAARLEKYLRHSKKLGSKLPARPLLPQVGNATRYEKARQEELYLIALEEWEVRCLRMQINAEKMRLSRIRKMNDTKGSL